MKAPALLLLVFTAHVGCASDTERSPVSSPAGTVELQVLAFNDFHGNLQPPTGSGGRIETKDGPVDAGGAEFFVTKLRELRAGVEHTATVTAGDVIGASPLLSALFHDEPTIDAMGIAGLDIAGVGNHEFDEGLDELMRMQTGGCHPVDGCLGSDSFAGASFSYLAANVTRETTGKTVLPPYEIRDYGGVKVGFIGMTLEGTPLVTAGWKGLAFGDEAETVNALVPKLQDEGVETIVVLLHEGGATTGGYDECEGISGPLFDIVKRFDPAVDLVVAGHTNAAHICDIDGMLVTSAASAGRLVTDVRLRIERGTGDVVSYWAENIIVERTVVKAREISSLIDQYGAVAQPLIERPVGVAVAALPKGANDAAESVLGNLVADAYHEATQGEGQAADLALVNLSGVRADVDEGQITFGELAATAPFGNTLVTMTLTGTQLHAVLEQQFQDREGSIAHRILAHSAGLFYEWDQSKPVGEKIPFASMSFHGEPVQGEDTFRITTNNFMADGGDGFTAFLAGTERVGGAVDLDAIEAFFVAHSPVSPAREPRIGLRGPATRTHRRVLDSDEQERRR